VDVRKECQSGFPATPEKQRREGGKEKEKGEKSKKVHRLGQYQTKRENNYIRGKSKGAIRLQWVDR